MAASNGGRPIDLSTVTFGAPRPDCANGIHVARLGSSCVCGDPGPAMRPTKPIVLGPERKLSYTAPH